jgi:hypothetical protein
MTKDYEMLRISSDKENKPADVEGLANVPGEGGDLAGQEGDGSRVNHPAVHPTVR